MTLSKDHCLIMRGLAILAIVLHNFIHMPRFGFTPENEFIYTDGRLATFFNSIASGSFLHGIGECFSFLGWMGVSVFVFLSGYGLVQKYEAGGFSLQAGPYIRHSWFKLFWLMLPAVLVFILIHLGDRAFIVRSLASLTLLANLPALYPLPHIYWYFGLTFELYLLYILFHRIRDNRYLLIFSLVVWCVQALLLYLRAEETMDWNTHNFFGWIPEFLLGIALGRSQQERIACKPWALILTAILSLGVMLFGNASPYLWILVRSSSVVFFFMISSLISETVWTRTFFKHLGTISAFLFVIHPLARTLTILVLPAGMPFALKLVLYLALAYPGALLYRSILIRAKRLSERVLKKNH